MKKIIISLMALTSVSAFADSVVRIENPTIRFFVEGLGTRQFLIDRTSDSNSICVELGYSKGAVHKSKKYGSFFSGIRTNIPVKIWKDGKKAAWGCLLPIEGSCRYVTSIECYI
jgi:hypothetical protein